MNAYFEALLPDAPPREVFPPWEPAQREARHLAREEDLPSMWQLRTAGFIEPDVAQRVSDWFTSEPPTPTADVRAAYAALQRETARLAQVVRRTLGVRVRYTSDQEPYAGAAELCADLRRHRTMKLRTIGCEAPHPLLGGEQGGTVDQLRVVHDVFGHAALGVGFDLQSEYAAWLQCRTLFSPLARPAAFCELVGAVTAYVLTGVKPPLRADLAPPELLTPGGS
jgi:hypothetical protein